MNYSNNAYSVLDGAIGAADTVIQVAGGSGARFPASDFMVTLVGYDISGNESAWEICHCTSRSGDTLTVARGQEGTAAVAWGDAARIEHRITAGTMSAIAEMQWNLSYSASVPDNAGGLDGDYHFAIVANWIYLYQKGIVTPGVWTYTGLQWVSETGIATMLADKADDSVALTDAAATATLPATTAEPVASRLQVLRNNIKQAFADLAGKAADSDVVKLTGAQTVAGVKTFSDRSAHAGAYTPSAQPAHSATPTFDCATSNVFEPAVLTGNVTSITLSNAVAGQTVQIRFQQDATGGRTVAVPSGAKVDGSINTAANRVSWLILTYSARGSRWEGNWLQVPL